jgi:hypothetical protein
VPSKVLPPTAPPEFRKDLVRAIQAIAAYMATASGGQEQVPPPSPRDCKMAFDWIINEASRYYDVPSPSAEDPNGRGDAFFNGRRFVAKQIVMAMQIKPELLDK